MSTAQPHLQNSVEATQKYVDKLLRLPFVKGVWVVGSRSSLTNKKPRPESDWDLRVLIEEGFGRIFFTSPRETGELHADVHWVTRLPPEAEPWEKHSQGA